MFLQTNKKIILASKSASRASLLKGSGLSFDVENSHLDEASIRDVLSSDGNVPDPADVAELLARAKAEAVSSIYPDAMVIGADQVLALDDQIFEKPDNLNVARENLLLLKGKTHKLLAAVCVAHNGSAVWNHIEIAQMTMRNFSPEFLGHYLAEAGNDVCQSVGAYKLESLGVHLFSKIEGDYFTILGLPLIPLLEFFRRDGIIES